MANTFIEIQDNTETTYFVNIAHIVKVYSIVYGCRTLTRVILTAGGGMIDSPTPLETLLNKLKG